MRPMDFSYTIADEALVAYADVPLAERLRWLEDLAVFTAAWRMAPREPTAHRAQPSAGRGGGSS